jgi:hypothetical protein
MLPPDNDRGRPLAETASNVGCDDYTTSLDPTCWVCGHQLRAARSVALGIGPVCWRRHSAKAAAA